jgi:hypothetical protein
MRWLRWFSVVAAGAAVLACNNGGGTEPEPTSGAGAGVWLADSDTTAHKLSFEGAPLANAGGFE